MRELWLAATAALAAAPLWAENVPDAEEVNYPLFGFSSEIHCSDAHLRIGYAGERALLTVAGRSIALNQAITASGAKYEDRESDSFVWSKGETAQVQLDGVDLGECSMPMPDIPPHWVGRGNEPGWRLDVTDHRLDATLNYGEEHRETTLPEARLVSDALRYDMPDIGLAVSVTPVLCHDDMSGRPYPEQVVLELDGQILRGCGGDTMDLLAGQAWQLRDLAEGPEIGDVDVTLLIDPEGRIAGTSGCNRYFGPLEITGEGGLNIGPLAVTRRMCAAPEMAVEQAFLTALSGAERFDLSPEGALQILQGDRVVITAAPSR